MTTDVINPMQRSLAAYRSPRVPRILTTRKNPLASIVQPPAGNLKPVRYPTLTRQLGIRILNTRNSKNVDDNGDTSVKEVTPSYTSAVGCLKAYRPMTCLHNAVKIGDINVIKDVLASGVDINIKNSDGNTALHIASDRGFHEIVGELCADGANVDIQNTAGNTALHIASDRGFYEVVGELLGCRGGADMDIQNAAGDTALHIASAKDTPMEDNLKVINLLIYGTPAFSSYKSKNISTTEYYNDASRRGSIKNNAGERPEDVAKDPTIKLMLKGVSEAMPAVGGRRRSRCRRGRGRGKNRKYTRR